MPGVIQPQRPQGVLGGALSAIQTVGAAKSAFGGGGQTADPTAQTSAGNVGDSTQAAQGQAVPNGSDSLTDPNANVFQRKIGRNLNGQGPMRGGY